MVVTFLDTGARTAQSPPKGDDVLVIRGLTKRFGSTVAVDNLDLTIRRGQVLGFLGPNGSGKSTTVSMVLGLVRPTEGSIHIMGEPLVDDPSLVARHVGAIIENPAFYPFLSGRDNLRAQARLAGGIPESRIDELLKLVNMEGRADTKYKTFSLGMKQRIGIASTLLTSPDLVILDEPTNGLDPAGQHEIRAIIPRITEEGQSVLLASHLLHDVEQVSDHVIIIRHGKKVTEGSVDDLLGLRGVFEVRLQPSDLQAAASIVRRITGVDGVVVQEDRLVVEAAEAMGAEINRSLAFAGLYPSHFARTRGTLEDLFLELTTDPSETTQR
jgi:ABC-2 type transport system ATP-binding protein